MNKKLRRRVVHISTLASIIAVLLATGFVLRVPGRSISWTVPAYLIAQFFFAVIAWWGLQKVDALSGSYMAYYALSFGSVLFLAILVTIRMAMVHPTLLGIFLLVGAAAQSAAIASVIYWELLKEYGGHVPAACQIAAFQAAVLAFCGAVTLTVTAAKVETELWSVSMALGMFWSAIAFLSWGYALGITRSRDIWIHLNNFLPAFLAVVAFAWLAFQLSGIQSELSRQEVTQGVVVSEQ
jgi:hypothetical protein